MVKISKTRDGAVYASDTLRAEVSQGMPMRLRDKSNWSAVSGFHAGLCKSKQTNDWLH